MSGGDADLRALLDGNKAAWDRFVARHAAVIFAAVMGVLWLSGGPMWRPLATAVISGLAFATALVLFVLPVLFGLALGWSEKVGLGRRG